jgi:hypothetical protein
VTSESVADLVDLERYPVHELQSAAGRGLVEQCREDMARSGAARLDGFVRSEAVAQLASVASGLVSLGFANDDVHTVYFEDVDESLPADDPRRMLVRSAQKAVAMDLLPADFGVRRLYAWDGLTHFVAAALGKDSLFRSEDPLDGCNVTVYEDGDELGWHFDRSEFSVTLMIQPAERGGVFEYVPTTRSADDERFGVVGAILAGERKDVIELPSLPGTLAFFRGRYSLHRVTPVEGNRPRLNSVLTYASEPGHRLNPLTAQLFYGRDPSAQ